MVMKYVKDFEFSSSGPKQVRGYMRGGSMGCAKGGMMSGYAKGGAADGDRMVKNPKKAMGVALRAIALSEAFDAGTKSKAPAKKAMGGMMHGGAMHGGKPPVMAVPIGMKKGGTSKFGVVMKEFGKGKLHSGSDKGPLVKSPKQAVAIALSEARNAKAPVKKAMGGMMHGGMMKAPVKKQMGGSMMGAPGAGAVSDKEIKTLKKVAMPILAKVAKARSAAKPAGPSRAQFDAMMAAQNAAPMITPRQRRAMNNETMIGRKTGGSVKC